MVRVSRRVDAREAFPAAHEVEERLPACRRRRRVVRIVEERAGRARQEDRVVLLEVRLVDVGRVVGDRRAPRAGLLAHLFDGPARERNRRMHEARRPWRARAPCAAASAWRGPLAGSAAIMACTCSGLGVCGLCRRPGPGRIRRAAPAGRQRRIQARQELLLRQEAGLGAIPFREPLVERRLHLVARDGAVLVGVDHGKDGRAGVATARRHRHDPAGPALRAPGAAAAPSPNSCRPPSTPPCSRHGQQIAGGGRNPRLHTSS